MYAPLASSQVTPRSAVGICMPWYSSKPGKLATPPFPIWMRASPWDRGFEKHARWPGQQSRHVLVDDSGLLSVYPRVDDAQAIAKRFRKPTVV